MIWVLAAALAAVTSLMTILLFDRYMRWKQRRIGLEVFYVAMQDVLPDLYALIEAIYRRSGHPPVLDYNPRRVQFVSVSLEEREELRNRARRLYGRTKPYFHVLRPKTISVVLGVRRLFGSLDMQKDKVRSEDMLSVKLQLQVLAEDVGLVERAAGNKFLLVPRR